MKHLFATGRYSGGLWHIEPEGSMKQWRVMYHKPEGDGGGLLTQYRGEAEEKYNEWAGNGWHVTLTELVDDRPSEIVRSTYIEAKQATESHSQRS